LAHQAGRLKQAVNWYRKALASNPNDPIAHYDLAIALEDLGDFGEAVREYQRALQANWNFPEAHFNLSRLYRAMGRILEATRHLRIYRRLTGKPS
jgi:Flp pilus assembly protein TadD